MIRASMGRGVADVRLRVWVPQGSEVQFVRQVAPVVEDLTLRGVQISPLVREFPTGAWGDESRDYHVAVRVPPAPIGSERLAARVEVVVGDQVLAKGLVRAVWSTDANLTTRIDPGGRPLHRPDQAGRRDPAGAGGEGRRRRAHGDHAARRGRQAGPRHRQRVDHAPAGQGGRRRRRRGRHGAAQAQRGPSRRDGPGHAQHQDDAHPARGLRRHPDEHRHLPQRPRVQRPGVVRHVRGEDRRRSGASGRTSPAGRVAARCAAVGCAGDARCCSGRADRWRSLPALRDAEPAGQPVLRAVRLRLHHRPGAARRAAGRSGRAGGRPSIRGPSGGW